MQKLHEHFIVGLETLFSLNLRMIVFSQISLALGYLIFTFKEDIPSYHLGRMTADYQVILP